MISLKTISKRLYSNSVNKNEIKRVVIIGGGSMGSGIAQVCSI